MTIDGTTLGGKLRELEAESKKLKSFSTVGTNYGKEDVRLTAMGILNKIESLTREAKNLLKD